MRRVIKKFNKFNLVLSENIDATNNNEIQHSILEYRKIIPLQVKLVVWKRGKGKCVICRTKNNLQFDQIIPFLKGGFFGFIIYSTFICKAQNGQILQNRIILNE